jgi:hypothetical protein
MNESQIKDICAAEGLDVARVSRREEVLVLTPASLEGLPRAEALRRIADRLGEAGAHRYVTVAVDPGS